MKTLNSPRALTTIEHITNRIFDSGRITQADASLLRRMILSDTLLTDEEMQRINRVMDRLKMGLLKVVD